MVREGTLCSVSYTHLYADRVPVYNSANIPTTPWTDYVTRTSLTHNHQISLSAGTEKSKLYMSLAYLEDVYKRQVHIYAAYRFPLRI